MKTGTDVPCIIPKPDDQIICRPRESGDPYPLTSFDRLPCLNERAVFMGPRFRGDDQTMNRSLGRGIKPSVYGSLLSRGRHHWKRSIGMRISGARASPSLPCMIEVPQVRGRLILADRHQEAVRAQHVVVAADLQMIVVLGADAFAPLRL